MMMMMMIVVDSGHDDDGSTAEGCDRSLSANIYIYIYQHYQKHGDCCVTVTQ